MQILPSLEFVSGTITQCHREEHPYKKHSTKQRGIHDCLQHPHEKTPQKPKL
jgi:hypothetical protein